MTSTPMQVREWSLACACLLNGGAQWQFFCVRASDIRHAIRTRNEVDAITLSVSS